MSALAGEYQHQWSGWPGAYCMKCGCDDPMEFAIANGHYDPYDEKWLSDEGQALYTGSRGAQPCPVSDEAYEEWQKTRRGG